MSPHRHFEAPPEPEEEMLALDLDHFFADDFGTTAAEQAAHEPLDARLARERDEVDEVDDAEPIEPPARRHFRTDDPGHWNVIATIRPNHELEARTTMATLGEIAESPFPGVILARVDDVGAFADGLAEAIDDNPSVGQAFGRVLPAQHTFRFESLADLEAITAGMIDDWLEDLADATFHVRCHRRGRVNDLDPSEEEAFLGYAIQRIVSNRGAAARITFDDPDVVIDIETLNDEGAVSMWTRDDLRAYPFLRID